MTEAELCQSLGIDRARLGALLAKGLPHAKEGRRRVYDPAAVRDWLLESGTARQRMTAKSLAEVAKFFGVAERTAAYWRARGMPGETGAYDLDEIEAWRMREGVGVAQAGDNHRQELYRIRAEREQIELDQLRGRLVHLDPIVRLLTRHVNEAKAMLDQLPDQVAALLPPKTPAESRRRVRERVTATVDAACSALADMLAAGEITAATPE